MMHKVATHLATDRPESNLKEFRDSRNQLQIDSYLSHHRIISPKKINKLDLDVEFESYKPLEISESSKKNLSLIPVTSRGTSDTALTKLLNLKLANAPLKVSRQIVDLLCRRVKRLDAGCPKSSLKIASRSKISIELWLLDKNGQLNHRRHAKKYAFRKINSYVFLPKFLEVLKF